MIDKVFFFYVLFCVALSFSYREYVNGGRDAFLLRCGLIFTLAADFFMLIVYNNPLGLACFITAQTFYTCRHMEKPRLLGALFGLYLLVFF
ncbi:MAG: hypothetical protein LBQ68_07490, partial [Clostridiales bacterium]|nr:hypothetical protein [Clostridiales bacterium]